MRTDTISNEAGLREGANAGSKQRVIIHNKGDIKKIVKIFLRSSMNEERRRYCEYYLSMESIWNTMMLFVEYPLVIYQLGDDINDNDLSDAILDLVLREGAIPVWNEPGPE